MGHDFVGDVDLTAHGIDGHQRAFELLDCSEFIEQVRDRGDLIGLFRNRELRSEKCCKSSVRRNRGASSSMMVRSCMPGESTASRNHDPPSTQNRPIQPR
jgi:hypothetical protein